MSMIEKTGITLPGREGRWAEAAVGGVRIDDDGVWVKWSDWKPGERDYVLFRRLSDAESMPVIRQGDGIRFRGDLGDRVGNVAGPSNGTAFLEAWCADGRAHHVHLKEIAEIWRRGQCIWRRGDAG
ncbi:MAG: hypothetical protein K2X87_09390 [Gemmataceae bacterium]|nr:hypothetical protein [Gemmataceae bacterium]